MRILLIHPRGALYRHKSGVWRRSLRYQPLTLTTLAALVPEELDAEVVLYDEGIRDVDTSAEADLVGISAITGSSSRAYEIADAFRSRGVPVVLGGPHPTLLPEEAAAHADAVVRGYAETSWPQLLRDFAAGSMRERYEQEWSFDVPLRVPPARRELLPSAHYVTAYTIEATRGCKHDCEFCVVPTAWGGFYKRPVAEVVDEIRGMRTRRLAFLDLNLIADIDYAKELFAALVPLGLTWAGLTTTRIAWDEELLDLLHGSGCRGLLIGLESLQQDSLLETRKGFNAREDFMAVVQRLHARRIAIMGCFALGFDHDDIDVFDRTIDFVDRASIDLPRFAILTPFPATPLHRRLEAEGRILTRDWSLYDAQHVVFEPARMTPEELQRGAERTWRSVYSYGSIARRLSRARNQLGIAVPANLAYRFYANNLHRYYTCGVSLA